MRDSLMSAIASVLGMFVTGMFGYMTAKSQNKKDMTISDRQLLSEDERQFRAELIAELARNREEINSLREEVERLRRQNINLEFENKQLQLKIDELRMELQRRYHDEDIEATEEVKEG